MLVDQFTERARAVGCDVHRCPTREDACRFVLSLLHEEGVVDAPGSYAVWSSGPVLQVMARDELMREVPGLRFDVTRETATSAKVGISAMDWALADTGTLVQDATTPELRLVSTLPEVHIALISADTVLPDLKTLFARITPQGIPYLAFITGPSRTADIERVLTIGVHGPGKLVILIVGPQEVTSE